MVKFIYLYPHNTTFFYRIDINMVIKVADFGLSVNIGAKEYYRLTKHFDVKLPVKWMAPESLADYMFSEMSDVVNDKRVLFFFFYYLPFLIFKARHL